MAEYSLALEVGEQFLNNVLGIRNHQDMDRFELLSQIIVKYHEKIPFQNITFMSSSLKQVQKPEEVINCVQKGYGGICSDISIFLYLLLKTLGYNAHLLYATTLYPHDGLPHAVTLIADVKKKGDRWLVDTGSFHAFSPIDLSFEQESPEYNESFAAYKYIRRGDQYIRLQRMSDGLPLPHVEDGWAHAYHFELKPVQPEQFMEKVDAVVYKGTQDYNWFHTLPLIMAYPDKRAVIFRKQYFIREREDGKLSREYIEGDIVKAVKQQFPTIPEQQIEVAIAKSKAYQDEQLNQKKE